MTIDRPILMYCMYYDSKMIYSKTVSVYTLYIYYLSIVLVYDNRPMIMYCMIYNSKMIYSRTVSVYT